MKDYSQGKIYKLFSVSNEDLVYYGSTIRTLNERLTKHINDYKNNRGCTSRKVIAAGDYKIELIENYPCNSKAKLERKEGEYTKNNKCVNEVIAGRTYKEYRKDNKEYIKKLNKDWYENNKERVKKKQKEYYENNKEAIAEYRKNNKEALAEKKKEYYENNKEAIAEKDKKYYEANKEAIAERKKEKVTCECGCIIRKDDLARHKKTNKHLELIKD